MEKLMFNERINAERGIRKAIANGFKKDNKVEMKYLPLMLLLAIVIYNVMCISEGTWFCYVCMAVLDIVLASAMYYFDIL